MAAEKTGDDEALIESLSVLAKMNPLDAADVHFRLASALHRDNQLDSAKRQVIMALDKAPRYRDAHALLLKIVEQQKAANPDDGHAHAEETTQTEKKLRSETAEKLDVQKELP